MGQYHASLIRTGDNKLLMLEDSGDLVLIDPSAKEYKELARSKVWGATSNIRPSPAQAVLRDEERSDLLAAE